MNTHTPVRMTVEQYLNWSEAQPEGRFELAGGEVIVMASERVRHVQAKGYVYSALFEAAKSCTTVCYVLGDGIGVRTGPDTVREPDASVQVGGVLDPDSMLMESPSILCEVLSPSSERSDTGQKLEEYFSLPSVQHYLIVNPDKKSVIHHVRKQNGHIDTVILHEGTIEFVPFGFSVRVRSFFDEVDE